MRRMFSKKQIENIADGVVDTAIEELTIPATKIDSGEAEAGKVLKADGEGGAEWGDGNALPDSSEALEGDVLEIDSNGDPNWNKLEGIYVGSHNASSGQVLMANGSGSTGWENVANGIEFNTAYNASTNKAATMSDIDTAIIATINANY